MLFKTDILKKIKSGDVNLAFRKWKRPTVKTGGKLKTPVGLLSIDKIDKVQENEISNKELHLAGYKHRSEFQKEIEKSSGKTIYRIRFHLAGPDPRIELRNMDKLTPKDIMTIRSRLDQFDRSRRYPGWAHTVMETILNNPGKSATWISELLEVDKEWLKSNIRKLKEMGLTISLEMGYKVSPRGKAYLESSTRE